MTVIYLQYGMQAYYLPVDRWWFNMQLMNGVRLLHLDVGTAVPMSNSRLVKKLMNA